MHAADVREARIQSRFACGSLVMVPMIAYKFWFVGRDCGLAYEGFPPRSDLLPLGVRLVDDEPVDVQLTYTQTGDASAMHDKLADGDLEVLPEYRVQVAAKRFRVPDVTVVDFASPVERIATRPPIAVFEVLSPEDTVLRIRRKLADYAKMGIPQIWFIDPEDGASLRYVDGELLRGEVFEEPSRGISFRIEEIGKLVRR